MDNSYYQVDGESLLIIKGNIEIEIKERPVLETIQLIKVRLAAKNRH